MDEANKQADADVIERLRLDRLALQNHPPTERDIESSLSSLGFAYESAMRAGLKSEAEELRRRMAEKIDALRALSGDPAVNAVAPAPWGTPGGTPPTSSA
jgi:hypothetical protein